MPLMAEPRWGDPAHSTFVKRFIRLVAVDDHQLKVNVNLQPVVEHMLRQLGEVNLVVEHIEGWPVYPAGTGIVLRLSPPDPQLVTTALAQYGFEPDPEREDGFYFADSAVSAVAKGKALDEGYDAAALGDGVSAPVVAPVAPTPPVAVEERRVAERDDDDWDEGLPGHRETEPGEVGTDVLFLQAYLGAPRTGVLDPETLAAVRRFQQTRGLTLTDRVSRQTWQNLVPHHRRHLSPGDGGKPVRILHAAIIAAGYSPRDTPVRAVFGVLLTREVREFQKVTGALPNGRVRTREWTHLLAPW